MNTAPGLLADKATVSACRRSNVGTVDSILGTASVQRGDRTEEEARSDIATSGISQIVYDIDHAVASDVGQLSVRHCDVSDQSGIVTSATSQMLYGIHHAVASQTYCDVSQLSVRHCDVSDQSATVTSATNLTV